MLANAIGRIGRCVRAVNAGQYFKPFNPEIIRNKSTFRYSPPKTERFYGSDKPRRDGFFMTSKSAEIKFEVQVQPEEAEIETVSGRNTFKYKNDSPVDAHSHTIITVNDERAISRITTFGEERTNDGSLCRKAFRSFVSQDNSEDLVTYDGHRLTPVIYKK